MKSADGHNRQTTAPFAAFYRRYVERIYAYCYRRIGNHADAEDLTEQVFAEALQKYDAYREQGKAAAWLFTIAHSRVVDHYRRRQSNLPLDGAIDRPGPTPTPERQLIAAERRQRLFSILDALDEDKRELILLRFGGELTYRQIGDVVGKSEAAVKMTLYRLLDQLRADWYLHNPHDSTTEEEHD